MLPLQYMPVLTTSRLTLRPWRLSDLADYFAYSGSEGYWRYLRHWPNGYRIEDAQVIVAQAVLDTVEDVISLAIVLDGKVVGGVNLEFEADERAILGYGLGREHWGKGLVVEAASSVLDFAFGSLAIQKVRATADAENTGSRRVMEKLGMVQEGHFRSHRVQGTERRDVVEYAVLRAEWLARHERG